MEKKSFEWKIYSLQTGQRPTHTHPVSDHSTNAILNSEGTGDGYIIRLEEKRGTKEIIHGVTMERKSILKRNRTEFLEPLNKR